MIDESNLSICVCFWGEKIVNQFDFSGQPVLAIKNAKVSDFAQKSLNSNEDSCVFLNCEFERAKDVKEWWDSLDKESLEIHPMSIGSGLENMLKDAPKDFTLKRFCSSAKYPQINPEDNTVESTDNQFRYQYRDSGQGHEEEEENEDDEDKNADTD
jgi:hypothetical protein